MASSDSFLAATSAALLLPRTLGPAAASASTAASPCRARGDLLDRISRPMKQSKELVEQARITMKEHGDIGKLYHDGGARVADAVNGNNNQPGRRPGLGRKRSRFSIKPPAGNTVQNVDFSVLQNIEDPDEYFSTLEQLEKAEKEIKRLRGEAPTEATDNHRAISPPKMRPGLLGRKSVHSYKFSVSTDIPDTIEASASQTEITTESQFTQDNVHASSPEMTKEYAQSRPSQHAIPDISVREDSLAEKDKSSTLNYLLSAFKNLDESEEENLLRKTLEIKEISIEKFRLPDFNVPDGKSDGSPESVVCKAPLGQASSVPVVLTISESSAANKTPSPSIKSPENVLEPEPNPPNGVTIDERPVESSPIGAQRDSEPAKEKGASCSHSASLEVQEDNMPMNHSTSPCHLEGGSTEVLVSTPSGNVSPLHHRDGNFEHQEMVGGDVAQDERPAESSSIGVQRDSEPAKEKGASCNHSVSLEVQEDNMPMDYPTSPCHLEGGSTEVLLSTPSGNVSPLHHIDGNFEHQEMVGGDAAQDNPIHTSEIPPEDPYLHNQADLHHGNIEKLVVNISNALSPSKGKDQKREAKKRPSKRGKKAAGETSDVELPAPNFDPGNQPNTQDTDVETSCINNSPSPSKGKRQKEAQRRNKKRDLNRRKSLADAGLTWQSGVRRSTRIRSRPLQQWLGERFVYGRIHGTMATVIGVKSLSPVQEGKVAMRVKSFVSEQYSDLLDKSAKY
ncbi:hypothetical protein GUJ93_ZPchr0008g13191 [Zizania palustris]|uniref:CENP-C n=1 Tax=Zizania palustris TaxID=103762 RepID=A0A8J5V0K5_ZIZPA|nr:hypothetical protein GUJ93_ZPchr0008g13191 [Zizania palustris]